MTRKAISVVGGVYHEQCLWPAWDQIWGSGGRAATAIVGHVDKVTLYTYARKDTEVEFRVAAQVFNFDLITTPTETGISFEYVHCMSTPVLRPALSSLPMLEPIEVQADAVLRFGMLEGSAKVDAKWCVYDPQSAFDPAPFWENGSKADHLAIVGNRSEIEAMADEPDPAKAAAKLIQSGAEVVVVKSGPIGAYVHTRTAKPVLIPAYRSEMVWTIGSGDVFAAVFAARWAVHRERPEDAAEMASRAVASYAETMGLSSASAAELSRARRVSASTVPGKVYLASPFFNLGQRWLVDEARRCLTELGLTVFSPVHDIGAGPAEVVGPADLTALDSCDRVFAILDGLDAGTVFEVGYARAKNLPVYVLAQSVTEEDLKMVEGSNCKVFFDFVTALHHTSWKT
ncbi:MULTISPECIES: PfkB family carbohydrate kinase [Paraburkholderia]|uniref:PfkB family carbohydrate kinase n=1 Tax=Paraburkholderia TaxID=1822464 RepID=UPI0022524EEF|nr:MULTISPECIES: PfkB family carbohydrate kinase [Paraburkholderia]MCX4156311.1 PfkB family carbohydrate kinase [Paraburkholderia aspalathi]MDN7165716.1 PfkB family carbohydrate kinase [Paraburkholderia sp. SECH2]MDQ6394202.1 PfkB family carbohydrate kinase [Paraburkholderia aspalathi]